MIIYEGSRRQSGGSIFQGSRRQRGGNIWGVVKRMATKFGNFIKPKAMSTAKDLAKRGLKVGVGALKDTAMNALSTNPLPNTGLVDNLKARTRTTLDKTMTDYFGADPLITSQDGSGLKRKRAASKSINNQRIQAVKKRKITAKRQKTVRDPDAFDIKHG